MKKTIALIIAAVMCLTLLAACGKKGGKSSAGDGKTEKTEEAGKSGKKTTAKADLSTPENLIKTLERSFREKDDALFLACWDDSAKPSYVNMNAFGDKTITMTLVGWDYDSSTTSEAYAAVSEMIGTDHVYELYHLTKSGSDWKILEARSLTEEEWNQNFGE